MARRHLAVLNQLSLDPNLRRGDVDAFAALAARHMSAVLGTDRGSVWLLDEGGLRLRPVAFHGRDGATDPGVDALPAADLTELLALGQRSRVLATEDTLQVPSSGALREHLRRQRIRARLDSAVRLGGEVLGVVSVAMVDTPRRWTPQEEAFVADVAHLVGQALLESRQREVEEDRRRLEVELERARRLEALGGLAGGIAHDFNNILASIVGNAELAQIEDARHVPELLDEILASAEQGRALVRQILQFARSEAPAREGVDLGGLVREVVRTLKPLARGQVQVALEIPPRLPPILGDRTQLTQVLLNLCSNALQALGGRGRLTLRLVEEVPAAGMGVHAGAPTWVRLEVEDDGPGIPVEIQEEIFEPFYTTRRNSGGTGLGLAIVDRTVRAHGGQVVLDSAPGHGTVFRLRLPVRDAAPAPPTDPGRRRRPLKVIAVDDDEQVLVLVRALLEHLRHEVTTFQHPNEVMAALDAGAPADVILADLFMEGVTGVQLAERVQVSHPDTRVVLMSASPHRLRGITEASGIAAVLPKPFTVQDLAGLLNSVT